MLSILIVRLGNRDVKNSTPPNKPTGPLKKLLKSTSPPYMLPVPNKSSGRFLNFGMGFSYGRFAAKAPVPTPTVILKLSCLVVSAKYSFVKIPVPAISSRPSATSTPLKVKPSFRLIPLSKYLFFLI